jgi:formate/nitrite transporter FocA (FNT family)
LLGADVTVGQIVFNNFLPVFAGNTVGASVFVSFMMWKSIMTGCKQPHTVTK